MKRFSFNAIAAAVLVLGALATAETQAATIEFQLNTVVTGGPAPAGSAPWLTATVSDTSWGGILLTLEATNLTGRENALDWYFNLNPGFNNSQLDDLNFYQISSSGSFDDPTITTAVNAVKAPSSLKFDLGFGFSNPSGGTFSSGDSVTYFINGLAGLDATDFNYTTSSGEGTYVTVAKIQQTGANGEGSVTVGAVPEPGHAIFGALLLGGLFWMERGRIRSFFSRETREA